MKHRPYIYMLLAVAALVSCRPNEPEYVDFTRYKGQANAFVPMREVVSDVRDAQPWNNIDTSQSQLSEDTLQAELNGESGRQPMRTSPLTVTDVARGFLESMLTYKVHQVAGTYRSIYFNGYSIVVSGKFFYPNNVII